MPDLPYNGGVPEVAPSARPSDAYQHISANANQFGGAIAEGAQGLAAGLEKQRSFFNDVASDNAANNYQTKVNNLLRGDPNVTVQGPDGKPMPDPGYLGTKGRTALDRRPEVQKTIDDLAKRDAEALQTPEQKAKFNSFAQKYNLGAMNTVSAHANGQADGWYKAVNDTSASLALTHIANNADNPTEVAAGASDLINARVKQAQVAGATPGDEVWTATIAGAKRDALTAQLEAVSVKDPLRAMRMLDKNKEIAGTTYDNLASKFRQRAEKQEGDTVGTEALKKTYEVTPHVDQAIPVLDQAGARYGVSTSYLTRTWQIEASGQMNPADSSTGAKGPFQFISSTARQYGLTNPRDFASSADAAARLAADNKAMLSRYLTRPPTDAELYIAHQQGAGGAAKLLANPTVRAGDLVGDQAIRVNGGDPNAPAGNFVQMWTARFNGAGAAFSASRKASAYQMIASDPNISESVRDHAVARVNRDIAMQLQAEQQSVAQRHLMNEQAASGIVTRLMTNQPVSVVDIANDPNLSWETKLRLQGVVEQKSGTDINSALHTYGPGFWDAYKAVSAPADDPRRIGDMAHLLALAGPGVDPNKSLTLAGVSKLNEVMGLSRKDVNASAVNTSKIGLMNYAKGKLSFEQDTGPVKIRDPKGEALFNADFIPKFEAAFDKWTKDGKDPFQFLTRENIDKMVGGMRSQSQMQADRMAALGETTAVEKDDKASPLPPVPDGVTESGWKKIVAEPPMVAGGQQASRRQWSQALQVLANNPNDEKVKDKFNKWFGAAGYNADAVLGTLKPTGKSPSGAAPAATPSVQSESLGTGPLQNWPGFKKEAEERAHIRYDTPSPRRHAPGLPLLD